MKVTYRYVLGAESGPAGNAASTRLWAPFLQVDVHELSPIYPHRPLKHINME
jgi:hypothetical protein